MNTKINRLKELIREEVRKVLKEADTIDKTKPYGVIATGGSIGSSRSDNYMSKYRGRLVATFDDANEAKEYAKRMKTYLTPGEKKYYMMSYKVVKL